MERRLIQHVVEGGAVTEVLESFVHRVVEVAFIYRLSLMDMGEMRKSTIIQRVNLTR